MSETMAGHKCERLITLPMESPREWWLGKLLEPIPDYPKETHCLHIKTPLKEFVLAVYEPDFNLLAAACYVGLGYHTNPQWIEQAILAFKPGTLAPAGRVCAWTWIEDDDGDDGWQPGCDEKPRFSEAYSTGNPDELYPCCMYCGGKIVAAAQDRGDR